MEGTNGQQRIPSGTPSGLFPLSPVCFVKDEGTAETSRLRGPPLSPARNNRLDGVRRICCRYQRSGRARACSEVTQWQRAGPGVVPQPCRRVAEPFGQQINVKTQVPVLKINLLLVSRQQVQQ